MRSFFYIILCLLIPVISAAQQDIQWVRTYDFGRFEIIKDIYSIRNGGFAFCGKSSDRHVGYDPGADFMLARLSDDGGVIWSSVFGEENVYEELRTVIQTDDGCFLTGGWRDTDNHSFMVYMVSGDGEVIWENCYGSGSCRSVIELKNGFFMLAGSGRDDNENVQGKLICINRDGDVIWQRLYGDLEHNDKFYAIRETAGGYVLLGRLYINIGPHNIIWIVKVNEEGELIWSRYFNVCDNQRGYDIVSCPQGGFAISGAITIYDGGYSGRYFLLLKIDDEGNQQWFRCYSPVEPNLYPVWASSINRIENSGYALVGPTTGNSSIVMVDPGGNEGWRRYYDHNDVPGSVAYFMHSVTANDNSIVAAGYTIQNGTDDGLIMKLVPEISPPKIVEYHPRDLEFEMLPDSVNFWVRVVDLQGDSLDYTWKLDGEVVSNDTFYTVRFDEFGDYRVQCVVRDTTGADSVQWLVHVVDLYIDRFKPHDLELNVLRNRSVDFLIRHCALEGDPVNYLWTMTNLNTRRDSLLGETDSITVQFTKAHDFRVEGIAYRNQTEDAVQWLVHCCSTIWEWWPQELELSLPIDDAADFGIWPFNSESDSLSVEWSLDGEMISDNWEIRVILEETGDHEIEVVVNDGCESDTLAWLVNVYDPDGIAGQTGMPILPEVLTLYPVYPNPFNAETSVRFYLPEAGNVRLQLHDLSGREVIPLVSGMCSSGFNVIHLNGTELPAGLYLMSLTSLDDTRRQKIVVVK